MSFLVQKNIVSVHNVLRKTLPTYSKSLTIPKITVPSCFPTDSRTYAEIAKKPAAPKLPAGSGGKIKEFPVETDTRKLQEYCCGSNILQEGEDVKLKPESEYPEWLFTLSPDGHRPLEELDSNSKEYWERVRVIGRRHKNYLHRFKVKIMRQF